MSECLADRLSSYEGDPGYAQYMALGSQKTRVKILLDGVEQRWCVTADRAQGFVRRHLEVEGKPVIKNGRIADEVVYGRVEFQLPKGDDEVAA